MGAARTMIETTESKPAGGSPCQPRIAALGLGRFAGVVGRGGMGVVVRIEGFPGSGGPVVLKLLRPELLDDPRAVERFRRELRVHHRLWSELQAPRLVPCLAVGESGGPWGLFEVLPYFELGNLEGAAAGLPLDAALRCLADAAEGLGALHGHGYIHRDVCPANIFVAEEGGVARGRLGDLGVAIPVRGNTIVRGTVVEREMRFSVGHPGYMDPWHGGTPLGDLYGLGATLYRLVTGGTPPLHPPSGGLRLPERDACRSGTGAILHARVQEVLIGLTSEVRERRLESAAEAAAAIQSLAHLAGEGRRHAGGRRSGWWSASVVAAAGLAALLVGMPGGSGAGAPEQSVPESSRPSVIAHRDSPTPVVASPDAVTGRQVPEKLPPASRPGRPAGEPAHTGPAGSARRDERVAAGTGRPAAKVHGETHPTPPAVTTAPAPAPGTTALLRAASRHVRRRELGAAETELRRVLELSPGDPRAASLLALVLSRRAGGTVEAAQVLREALERHPDRSALRVQLSRLLAAGGDVPGAMAVLDAAPPAASGRKGMDQWRVTLESLQRRKS